jgi:hypothetical protein
VKGSVWLVGSRRCDSHCRGRGRAIGDVRCVGGCFVFHVVIC